MTKVHGKRYAYKFDFQGLAAATQPAASDPAYKYQSDLFMTPYHHGAKLSSFMSPHHGMTSSSGEFSPSSSPTKCCAVVVGKNCDSGCTLLHATDTAAVSGQPDFKLKDGNIPRKSSISRVFPIRLSCTADSAYCIHFQLPIQLLY